MKEVVELDLCLLTIIIGGIDQGDPSDTSGVELVFVPLMISNVEFEFFHVSLNGMESAHLAQARSCEDSVDNEEGGLATISSA